MPDLSPINLFRIRVLSFVFEALLKVLGVKVVVTGIERSPTRSVVFVCNHYTRLETILLPYVIHRRLGIFPRSLTARYVFEAFPRRFMESIGSVPVNIADRDSVAIKSLLSGESWIIFPEGEMVKDRKVVFSRRFGIHEADGAIRRPPHTGAAAIALKAQLAAGVMSDFAERYRISKIFGVEHLIPFEVKIVPVNITYWPQRFFRTRLGNLIDRIVHLVTRSDLPARYEEELTVESSFLRRGSEIIVNFGAPRGVAPYTPWLTEKAVRSVFQEKDVKAFGRAIRAVTTDYMTEVYRLTTVNPDHLMARLLTTMVVRHRYADDWEDIRRRVLLAALSIRELSGVSCHRTIAEEPHALAVWGDRILDGFLDMGSRQGLLEIRDGRVSIREKEFKWPQRFHSVRVANTIEVITNEIEPLPDVTKLIDKTLTIRGRALVERSTRALVEGDRERFLTDYARFFVKDESREMKFGMPALHVAGPRLGVLLVHGYLASPEQMRPLLEYLTRRGISAYNVRLSGHGTSVLDLATRSRWDWFYSVRYGYTILARLVERVFVCGFGTGGVLGWLLAAQNPPRLSGIVSISAAMRSNDRFERLAPIIDTADHLARSIGLTKAPAEFTNKESENPHFTYPRNPVHGMYQIRTLIREVGRGLGGVTVPALIIQGGDNPAVDEEGAREYLDAISSRHKRLILVRSPYHGIVYRGTDEIFEPIASFVDDPERTCRQEGTGPPARGRRPRSRPV
jgi:esterase/lipase/1-acyl-sn-glycerol-3-phosphate acyltransferase